MDKATHEKAEKANDINVDPSGVRGVFETLYTCKHSVRYKPSDDYARAIATAIYLMMETYEALNRPAKIIVEVRPVVD